jgi:hypothetical protein
VDPDLDIRRQNDLRKEKSVMTDENYGCKGQGKTMDLRNRGKLRLQGTEETMAARNRNNYGCKGPMKIMAARNRGKLWLQGTEEN